MKFLGLVWSNLKRKKLRTALTLLSIFVAFLLFGFLCAIKEAFVAGVSMAGADRLVVRHKVSLIQTLPRSYEQRIAGIPGVAAVVHQTWFGGIYQEPKNFFATIPVEPEKFLEMYPGIHSFAGTEGGVAQTRTGAIVGRLTDGAFQMEDRRPRSAHLSDLGQPANQSHWEFEIVGIYDGAKKNTDTTAMFFRYDYFDEARTRGKGEVGWFMVRVNDADQAAEIAKEIDAEFANSPYETKAEPEGAFAAGFAQQVGDIGTIMVSVMSAVFFTILLVAGNTMGQAVRERIGELGVLKAIGFTNELVLVLVLLESCLIAAVGGLTGLGLAWLIISTKNPVPALLPIFYLPPRDLVIGIMVVIALGVVAGAFPAIQAMRLRVAEALRRNA